MKTSFDHKSSFIVTTHQIRKAPNKFINHISFVMRKNKKKINGWNFSFRTVTYYKILKKIFDTAKAYQKSDIQTRILKNNWEYFAIYFYWNINQCISQSKIPSDFQLTDVTPFYKKEIKNLER